MESEQPAGGGGGAPPEPVVKSKPGDPGRRSWQMGPDGPVNNRGQRICGSRLRRRPGEVCHVRALMPNGRCRIHGGVSLSGPASPRYKDGRTSRYSVPPAIQPLLEYAANDRDLLSMRQEVEMLTARMMELSERLTPEGGADYMTYIGTVRATFDALEAGVKSGKADRMIAALEAHRAAVHGAVETILGGEKTWAAWTVLSERRQRLVESEQRRMVALGQMIPADRAYQMVQRITESIARNVPDRRALTLILADLRRLLAADQAVFAAAPPSVQAAVAAPQAIRMPEDRAAPITITAGPGA